MTELLYTYNVTYKRFFVKVWLLKYLINKTVKVIFFLTRFCWPERKQAQNKPLRTDKSESGNHRWRDNTRVFFRYGHTSHPAWLWDWPAQGDRPTHRKAGIEWVVRFEEDRPPTCGTQCPLQTAWRGGDWTASVCAGSNHDQLSTILIRKTVPFLWVRGTRILDMANLVSLMYFRDFNQTHRISCLLRTRYSLLAQIHIWALLLCT